MAEETIKINLPWRFERIYLRNVNVTLHDTPDLFDMKWQPNADMNIHGDFRRAGDHRYEVSLKLTMTCKNLDKLALEMTLEQAALVRVQSEKNQSDVQRILAVGVTNALFPYVREAVDNIAVRMSLPPLMLGHFNFEKVFEEGLRQMNLKQAQSAMSASVSNDEVMN